MADAPRHPDALIADALQTFIKRAHVTRVHCAESGATTPPPLAYFVHFPRLYVALSGRDAMWVELSHQARLLHLEAGEAVLVPANCWNRPLESRTAAALNVLFGRKQIGLSLVSHAAGARAVKTALPAAFEEAPRAIMQALLALRGQDAAAAVPLVEALLRSLVTALTATPTAPRRRATSLHESVCMYVQEHFQSAVTRASVAAHFHISPNHVSRLFKREGMVSFNQYVTYVRVNWAKHLLRNHHQSVDEVAAMCGFTETGYFCRVFKRRTGLTPSAYRQLGPRAGADAAEKHRIPPAVTEVNDLPRGAGVPVTPRRRNARRER